MSRVHLDLVWCALWHNNLQSHRSFTARQTDGGLTYQNRSDRKTNESIEMDETLLLLMKKSSMTMIEMELKELFVLFRSIVRTKRH